MTQPNDDRASTNMGSTLLGFALGAAIGAGFALLLAPDSGRGTRSRLVRTARGWRKQAGNALDQARDVVAELGSDANSAIQAGQASFQQNRAALEAQVSHLMPGKGESSPLPNAAKGTAESAAR